MRLFNTMTQQIEAFTPRDEPVKLYVCGVTPYDTAHLGHAMVFGTFDTLTRVLRHAGLEVAYTQNVTDIDDPLFEKAQQLGNITWDELARQETDRFVREMDAINIQRPTYFVRASEELPAMFAIIEQLLERGNAYTSDGWVYYSVASDPTYGQLANAAGIVGYDNLLAVANQRGNDPVDPRKRDPLDFLLWRGAISGEPSWPSPFGPGRPGWHIECSAMSTKYLGPQLDIHGGGTDLIFPHHSSEIAQTEYATGVRPFASYWMHVGMVGLDGTKMSKSLGNLIIVGKLLEKYTPDAVRALLASHHYRSEWEYVRADMEKAQALADRLTQATVGTISDAPLPEDSVAKRHLDTAMDALRDDLDTPRALAELAYVADSIFADEMPDHEAAAARGRLVAVAQLMGLRLGRD